MRSMMTISKMDRNSVPEVSKLFAEFDSTEIPGLIGLRRRQLFLHQDVQIHLYDFAEKSDQAALEKAKADPRMARLSVDLHPFVTPYEPETWNSPADSAAVFFYGWESDQAGELSHTETTVTVSRMDPEAIPDLKRIFREFDTTAQLMGIRRRQLFAFKDLCIHVQDHSGANGADLAKKAATDIWRNQVVQDLPQFDLRQPATDGHASRFYGWVAS
ncbi:TcmI family type II polyketide cyclase [Streptomyces sp. NPDC085995]|uniref:TcmI family type II polyketide cyclase n=1 Tax=Streptomyces sp. NPDC085995 TaxID=3154861 RepID=UPI0034211C2F